MISSNRVIPSAKSLSKFKSLCKAYVRREIPFPISISLEKPIFVLGSSRSGTTILVKTLGYSPHLCLFNENDIVRAQIFRMIENPHLIDGQLPELAKTFVRLSGIRNEQRLLEKSPAHSLLAKNLADYFVDAQFIHIVRDGRDVAFSMLKHSFISQGLRGERKVFWFDLLPEQFRQQWKNLTPWERGVLRWAVYLSKSREISGYKDRYLELRYEDFCETPQAYIEKIFSFLQLPVSPELKGQALKVASHKRKRWQDKELTTWETSFYHQVTSVFELDEFVEV